LQLIEDILRCDANKLINYVQHENSRELLCGEPNRKQLWHNNVRNLHIGLAVLCLQQQKNPPLSVNIDTGMQCHCPVPVAHALPRHVVVRRPKT